MMASSSTQQFSLAQVCEIITGEDGGVHYVFEGSDDELDALELDESDTEDVGLLSWMT